jgi:hypothetical protein
VQRGLLLGRRRNEISKKFSTRFGNEGRFFTALKAQQKLAGCEMAGTMDEKIHPRPD